MINPERLKALLKEATAARAKKNYELTIKNVDLILQFDSKNLKALNLKGSVLVEMERYEEAEIVLNEALEQEDYTSMLGLVKIYDIKQDYQKLLSISPKLVKMLFEKKDYKRYVNQMITMANAYAAIMNWRQACNGLRQLLDLSDKNKLIKKEVNVFAICTNIVEIMESRYKPKQSRRFFVENDEVDVADELIRGYYRLFEMNRSEKVAKRLLEIIEMERQREQETQSCLASQFRNSDRWMELHYLRVNISKTIVALGIRVKEGYQAFLETFDTDFDYPKDILDIYLKFEQNDETSQAIRWLEQGECNTCPEYSLFAAFVASNLNKESEEQVLTCTALALRLITNDMPKMQRKLRLLRANAYLCSSVPHFAEFELHGINDAEFHLAYGELLLSSDVQNAKVHLLKSLESKNCREWALCCLEWLEFLEKNTKIKTKKLKESTYLERHRASMHYYWSARSQTNLKESQDLLIKSVQVLGASAQKKPQCSETFFYLGHLYENSKKPKCWKKAIAINPKNERAVDALSLYYLNMAKVGHAIQYYKDAFDVLLEATEVIQSRFVYQRLGFLCLKIGKLENAESYFHNAIRMSQDLSLYKGLAQVFIETGKYLSAIKALQQVEQDQVVLFLLAKCYLKLRRFDECKNHLRFDYTPSIALAGDYYVLFFRECFDNGQYQQCAEIIKEGYNILELSKSKSVVKRVADLLLFWTMLPHLCLDLKTNLEKAHELYVSVECYKQAARVQYELKNYEKAMEHLNKEKNLDSEFWHLMGIVYAELKDQVNAQHCFITSLNLEPRNYIVWTNLGVFYEQNMDEELARRCYDKAITLNPEYSPSLFARARTLPSCTQALHDALVTCSNVRPDLLLVFAKLCAHYDVFLPLAEDCIKKYLEWAPNDDQAWNLAGCIQERNSNLFHAEYSFNKSLRLQKNNRTAILNYARVLALTNPTKSIELYNKVQLNRQNLFELLAFSLADLNSNMADEILNLHVANDPELDLFTAQVCYKSNPQKYMEISKLLLHPSNSGSLCALGMLHGVEEFVTDGLLKMRPAEQSFVRALYHTINDYDYNLALRALQRSVFLEPWDVRAWARLMKHCLRYTAINFPLSNSVELLELNVTRKLCANEEDSLRSAQQLVRLNPQNIGYRNLLNVAIMASFKTPPCLFFAEQRESVYSLLIASESMRQQKMLTEAMKYAEQAAAFSAHLENGSIYDLCFVQLGRIFAANKEFSQAEEMFKRGIHDPMAQLELAVNYIKMGSVQKSIPILKKFQCDVPSFSLAASILLFLVTDKPIALAEKIKKLSTSKYCDYLLYLARKKHGKPVEDIDPIFKLLDT